MFLWKREKEERKPEWFKIKLPTARYNDIRQILKKHYLNTVCAEAHCPNISECWSSGTATFMILGDTCTRGCKFCNVKKGKEGQNLDENEPEKLVKALKEMNILDYVVITSVDRDDLSDQGSLHFAKCIRIIKKYNSQIKVEVLMPDFSGKEDLIQNVINAKPDVIAHNIEIVERLQSIRDKRANYKQSLHVLDYVKKTSTIITKSSIMLGLGETKDEVIQSMKDLRNVGVDILTFGQYLRPSRKHIKVKEYVNPLVFEDYKNIGDNLGFKFVASSPFVRSSYRAGKIFKDMIEERKNEKNIITV